MSSPEAFAPRGLWRHRPFLHYVASRALSEFSYQIAAVAVGWQIYALTHSAFDLGLAGLVQFLPSAHLMFPAGHAAVRCRPAPGNLPRSQDLPLAAYSTRSQPVGLTWRCSRYPQPPPHLACARQGYARGRRRHEDRLFINASNQLGAFESGATAALLGAVPAVVLGGINTVAVALFWMKWFPTLRRVERLDGAV